MEKPTGHTVNESRAMLRAAKESGRVVQVGLHRRIGPHHVSGMKFLKSGAVGDVGMVRLFAHSAGGGIEKPVPNEPVPDGMDWDFWCGPAPKRPFSKKLHPGGWRNTLDFANGTLGDWGVHWLDQVLWWSGEKYPRRIFCTGGRPISGPPGSREKEQTSNAPDHQVATYEFEKFTCVWEHRKFGGNDTEKHKIGSYYYGTKGVLHSAGAMAGPFTRAQKAQKSRHEDSQLQEPDGAQHQAALGGLSRSDRPAPRARRGHRTRAPCLRAPAARMISWRTGRGIAWDADKEQITGDTEANALLSRPYRGPWVYPV